MYDRWAEKGPKDGQQLSIAKLMTSGADFRRFHLLGVALLMSSLLHN